MEEVEKGGKDPFIQKNNSGKVYYSNTPDKKQKNFTLGEVECKECSQLKPFEQVRWNRLSSTFACLTCFPIGD